MFIRERNGFKYRIYTSNDNKTIIAVSSFAGKTVKGIAKCDPADIPNLEKGIDLAILRCDEKIATKKMARGYQKLEIAKKELAAAEKYYEQMEQYCADAEKKLLAATNDLIEFQDTL